MDNTKSSPILSAYFSVCFCDSPTRFVHEDVRFEKDAGTGGITPVAVAFDVAFPCRVAELCSESVEDEETY